MQLLSGKAHSFKPKKVSAANLGLTIHYKLSFSNDDVRAAKAVVEKIRQLALDLPFESVGDIVDINTKQYDKMVKEPENENRWMLIQAGQSVELPWNKRRSIRVSPKRLIAFEAYPGDGSEPANIGLCLYPAEEEMEYRPTDDQRFIQTIKEGCSTRWEFSWDKWRRYAKKNKLCLTPSAHNYLCNFPTKLNGWRWSSFCKTQYASNDEYGGVPNFLKCHISVITLLERAAKLPGLKVKIEDEGKYGPSTYSDDYKEAYAAGREPKYTAHKGRYSPKALAEEVVEWNEMLAATFGCLKDALGSDDVRCESPIADFPSFETLEFRGHKKQYLKPFLEAMKNLSSQGDKK